VECENDTLDVLLDEGEAATYIGRPLKFLQLAIRAGTGPIYVRPSPKKKLFDRLIWMPGSRHGERSAAG
jgi:hypothetical protein